MLIHAALTAVIPKMHKARITKQSFMISFSLLNYNVTRLKTFFYEITVKTGNRARNSNLIYTKNYQS